MNFQTPDSIIQDLVSIRAEASKGVDALFAAEQEVAECRIKYDTAYSKAFIAVKGTVADREALAFLETENEKFALDIASAKLSRVKAKLRVLQDAQTSIQTQARMVELTYKTAGLGER